MINVRHIFSTMAVFSTVGDIMSTGMGVYLEYCGGYSVSWRDIMSTMGMFSSVVG